MTHHVILIGAKIIVSGITVVTLWPGLMMPFKEKEGENIVVGNIVNIENTVDTTQTRIMFRYMIDDVRCGGCVVAVTEEEAHAKVKSYYDDYFDEGYSIMVWVDEDMPGDVVQVYP